MILGLGTDIVEIARVAHVYDSTGQGFVERILTDTELARMPENQKRIPAYLAKRFAVKEAAAKALGTGIAQGVSFKDFSVEHTDLGAPKLIVTGAGKEHADKMGVKSWHVSISDEAHYVVATVIAES
jgi:holo-[acyl-carrier protein] synthase